MFSTAIDLIFSLITVIVVICAAVAYERKIKELEDHIEIHNHMDSIPVYYNDSITLQFLAVE